ncbi:hypothetical protein GCM10023318_38270 [Nocardia callitridis]|uniref:Tryptophan synthase beta chain-like PALP domain-containing protein n=1 Tax=Nocardia callitridis TaxID=648753 RepID=A0ABP9KKE1_9NOCA
MPSEYGAARSYCVNGHSHRAEGADVLVTTGAPQSNHARLTAAAAARAGLRSVLVFPGPPPTESRANGRGHCANGRGPCANGQGRATRETVLPGSTFDPIDGVCETTSEESERVSWLT